MYQAANKTNKINLFFIFSLVATFALVMLSPDALAQAAGGNITSSGGVGGKVCGFFTNITTLLKYASLAIVTIALVFAGYQIAFAHKRLTEVATVLVGGLLIGGAGQLAAMLIPAKNDCNAGVDTAMNLILPMVHHFHLVQHFIG